VAKNSLNVLALPLSITTDRLHLLVFGKKRGFDHPRFLFLTETSQSMTYVIRRVNTYRNIIIVLFG